MIVSELIQLLASQNPSAPVILHDPDTGWGLPLCWGRSPHIEDRGIPEGAVVIHAHYSDKEDD